MAETQNLYEQLRRDIWDHGTEPELDRVVSATLGDRNLVVDVKVRGQGLFAIEAKISAVTSSEIAKRCAVSNRLSII